ncbi:hypothetical protein L2E82_24556 [Cichorium intybus]|uniref:Uncharacterized protein n=1 Tax=Cichorium intybus TaxID=13427 RepID=A0ACB9E129_CICIN|nr:hypothetical protein L2E82_24556 [Cichorium intybus]
MFDSANNENKSDDLDSPLCISIEYSHDRLYEQCFTTTQASDSSPEKGRLEAVMDPILAFDQSLVHLRPRPLCLLVAINPICLLYSTPTTSSPIGSDLFNSASSSIEGRSILHFIIGATSSLSKVGCGLMPSHRLKVGCRQLTHSLSSDAMCTITLKVRT